jgi:hypothetical protein
VIKSGCGAKVTPVVDESVVIDINPDTKDMFTRFFRWLWENKLTPYMDKNF